MAATIRLTNQEKDTKSFEYREGAAPKAGEKDTRPLRTLILGSSADRGKEVEHPPTVEVDEAMFKLLCADPRWRSKDPKHKGWLDSQQVTADRGSAV